MVLMEDRTMTPQQLGVLSALFDQIKVKVNDETLKYRFVKENLSLILSGDTIKTICIREVQNLLVHTSTFKINPSPEIKELNLVRGGYRSSSVEGYEDVRLRIGTFFTEGGSPPTDGGGCAVFESATRISLMEAGQGLTGANQIDVTAFDKDMIEKGISFSIIQVLDILKNKQVELKKSAGGIIFFVHNAEKTEVGAVISSRKNGVLLGREWNNPYTYSANTLVVSRTFPKHLQPK
jgi:hypothetical protein